MWVDTVANVRIHGETHKRPIDRFEDERALLGRLNPAGFDLAQVRTVRASTQFRVAWDTNTYTVPARHAGQWLTIKAYADRVCIYEREQLVADAAQALEAYDQYVDKAG